MTQDPFGSQPRASQPPSPGPLPPPPSPADRSHQSVSLAGAVFSSERRYFVLLVIVQVLIVIGLTVTIVGIGYLIGYVIVVTVLQGMFLGYLRGNAVRVGPDQLPQLHAHAEDIAGKLAMKLPDVYVLQGDGLLNAFATRYFGRNFVVLYSDIVEPAFEEGEEVVRYIVAHELAHHKRRHLTKLFLLWPARLTPLLGKAYSRSCEYTCDAFAARVEPTGAERGIALLASGKRLFRRLDGSRFIEQGRAERGFWVWLAEVLSTHPFLPQRLAAIQRVTGGFTQGASPAGAPQPMPGRPE